MNTIENNKLIAEFMGYKWFEVNKPYIAVREINGGIKHFQTDWNDLIEVVKKIVNLKIFEEYDTILFYEMFNTLKIEVVYNACVTFIKWYNKQTAEENK